MASGKTIGFKEIGFIFTAMLMLIFGVFTYVLYDESGKIRRDLQAKTKEANDEKNLSREKDDEVNQLKSKIGYTNVATVGSATDTNRDSVLGSMSDDIKSLGGPELQRDSYAETLRAMKQKVDNLLLENRNLTEKTGNCPSSSWRR